MRNSGSRGDPNVFSSPSESQIEELLHQTQDDLLLSLSVNSHTTSSSSSLNPDLSRRFEALKAPKPNPGASQRRADPKPPTGRAAEDFDDLESRFAALKASSGIIVINSDDTSNGDDLAPKLRKLKGTPSGINSESSTKSCARSGRNSENHSEKSEVDKLLEWAMDEARLNPSLKSDDEDYEDREISDDDDLESDDDDDEEEDKKKKGNNVEGEVGNGGKGKGKGKRWGFF